MKKKFLLSFCFILIVHCTLYIDNCFAQWVQTSSGLGNNKTVRSLAILGNNIFAGTHDISNPSGVYLSTDNGGIWTQTALNSISALSLVVSGNYIFAGTWENINPNNKGVWRSSNNGSSWSQTGLYDKTIGALAVSGIKIFAGTTNYGVYISTDTGSSWTQTSLNDKSLYSFAISGNILFAGTNSYGVYRSADNGSNWTQIGFNNKNVYSIAASGSNVFAGLDSGVYFSANNGDNWIQTNLNNKIVESIIINGSNVFAGTYYGGVYLSTNNGANWIEKNQGFSPIPRVYALLVANNYIFAGINALSVWRRPYSEIIGIQNLNIEVPCGYVLYQNYPNPFNPTTKIKFSIPNQQRATDNAQLIVYDILGREVITLVNEKLKPGTYEVTFSINQFSNNQTPSGVYFYTLTSGSFKETKKLLLLK